MLQLALFTVKWVCSLWFVWNNYMLSTFTYYFVAYFSIYKNSLIFRRKILTNILGLHFLQNSPKISTCSETFICLFILAERRERSEFIVSSRKKRARSQHINRAIVLVAANLSLNITLGVRLMTSNLVPRVLSVGRVGENPGNEVEWRLAAWQKKKGKKTTLLIYTTA